MGKNFHYNHDEFFKKIRTLHGDKYDFSKFIRHKDRRIPSVVICPKHGEFKISAHYVLKATKGFICKECRNENQQKLLFQKNYGNITLRNFLIKLLENKKYCSEVDIDKIPEDIYFTINSNNRKKCRVELFCKKHGRFIINISSLVNYEDSGCPDCKKENGLNCKKTLDKKSYLPYLEAKIYMRKFKIKNKLDYYKWWEENKPNFLPKYPHRYYGKY